MNSDWKAVCPNCHRSSSWVEDGVACPYCGTCSKLFERWLEHHFKLGWAIAVVMVFVLFFIALVINISAAQADEPVVREQRGQVILDYPDGSVEYRKYDDRNVRISGERNGKLYFDIKPKTIQKVEDIDSGIYHQTKKYYEKSPE